MKIRNPWLIKLIGLVGACLIRLWIGTLSFRYRPVGPNYDLDQPRGLQGRYLFAFWHEYLLLLAPRFGRPEVSVLISQHADGEMIAEVCRHLRFGLVRGSTTRGGSAALWQMLRVAREGHLAITPDGPRGPRRKVQQGLVFLASRTGLPIVPVGIGYGRAWRLRSWDRFAIPTPWSPAACVTLPAITVPPNLGKEQLEVYRLEVEQALLAATEQAELLVSKAKVKSKK